MYENYVKSLPNKYRSQIESFPSNTVFKFGDGRKVTATKRVIFPVFIAQTNCKINAEIVKENISLLLSKTSLKRARAVIDMNNDKATIFAKEMNLHL